MNILVIDNFQLGFTQSDEICVKQIKYSSVSKDGFDCWLKQTLDNILQSDEYDLIVLPFSLSTLNHAEYTGLRAAAFIRLMAKTENYRKPILFNGLDSLKVISACSTLSTILLTPKVYVCHELLTNSNLNNWIEKNISAENIQMSEQQYERFLSTFVVEAPSKFADRHSVANEWAVRRWGQLLGFETNSKLEYSLYFAYKVAKEWATQNLKKWRRNNPTPMLELRKNMSKIPQTSVIRYIDDEYAKGWDEFFLKLFEGQENIDYECFKSFDSSLSREELCQRLKDYVDSADADCYIIDLRLHESDSDEDDFRKITGHQLIKYILNKNNGTRIILFTASNKVWNIDYKYELQDGKIGTIFNYVIKDSPEENLTLQESYLKINKLINCIIDACCQSYIKKYVEFYKNSNISGLDGFIDLLILDKTKDKDFSLKMLLLLLIFFIEDYIKTKFTFHDYNESKMSYILFEQKGDFSHLIEKKIVRLDKKDISDSDYDKFLKEYAFCETGKIEGNYNWAKPQKVTGEIYLPTLLASALRYYYSIEQKEINFLMAGIRERNNIAHRNAECRMTIEDIKELFELIVMPIMKRDSNNN